MPRLELRPSDSQWMRYGSPVIAVALTIISGLVIFAALGKDPIQGFEVFFLNPLKSFYHVSELLLKATPLAICAIGLAIGFRANVWNIGAEGQFILGAIFATGVALFWRCTDSDFGAHDAGRHAWRSVLGIDCCIFEDPI